MRFLTGLTAVLCITVAGSLNAQEVAAESTPFDGDGTPVFPVELPEDIEAANAAPCGEDTVAVLETADGGVRYAFCAFGYGRSGVLEVLEPGKDSASILGASPGDPARILSSLINDTPEPLIRAMERGAREDGQEIFHATIPEGRITEFAAVVEPSAALRTNECGNNQDWIEAFLSSSAKFYRDEINCTNHHLWGQFSYCSLGSHRFHNSGNLAGWSQRTASASPQTTDGACVAYGQVRSCAGNTNFQALRRGGTSGSWDTSLNYWVQNGVRATWLMYASADRCTKGKDKDDFRYRAESVNGAGHRYGYMFVRELTDTGPCVACTSN